ncbi:MAG: SDR family oxidoreductase [Alphaproteobacteria bacterium]|nr:SDR family oxidoreductase [Alphaproteobacteria bacterium]
MTGPFDYSTKTVFVSGGTSGINLAIAKAFAAAGARVGVMSRNPERVAAAAASLSAIGPQARGYTADVRNFEAVTAAIDAFALEVSRIDVLVSGAAGNFLALARDLSPNGFKAVVDIDLLGTFQVMKAAYRHLAKPGASVINISAPQAYIPFEMQVHACAAKAGVDQVTRVLAKEWGPEGVRVNSISPGPIAGTEGLDRLAQSSQADIAGHIPLRRCGTVDDIARAALFLASDMASYVTGAVLPVDGGWGLSASGGQAG